MQESARGFVKRSSDIEEMPMEGGAGIRWLITHRDGAENYSMRLINIKKDKSTPYHSHDYEHEIFVVDGSLDVTIGEKKSQAPKDSFIFIPPNAFHGMTATVDTRLICVVPVKAARKILGD